MIGDDFTGSIEVIRMLQGPDPEGLAVGNQAMRDFFQDLRGIIG